MCASHVPDKSQSTFTPTGFFDRLFGKRQDDAQLQTPVVQEICITLIRIIPSHWDSVALTLGVPEHGLGEGMSHSISSPEGHRTLSSRQPRCSLRHGSLS